MFSTGEYFLNLNDRIWFTRRIPNLLLTASADKISANFFPEIACPGKQFAFMIPSLPYSFPCKIVTV